MLSERGERGERKKKKKRRAEKGGFKGVLTRRGRLSGISAGETDV